MAPFRCGGKWGQSTTTTTTGQSPFTAGLSIPFNHSQRLISNPVDYLLSLGSCVHPHGLPSGLCGPTQVLQSPAPAGPLSTGASPLWRPDALLFVALRDCNPLGEIALFPQTPYASGPQEIHSTSMDFLGTAWEIARTGSWDRRKS